MSIVACAVLGMSAASVRAQDDQPALPPYLLHNNRPVPGNGAIAIVAPASSQLKVGVVGGEDVEVAGSVRFLEGSFWSWTPDEPMSQGSYSMYMRDREGRSTVLAIEVVSSIERKPPDIDGTPSLSLVTEQTDQVCCYFDDGVNLIWLQCTSLTGITSVVLTLGLSSSSPAALLDQYLFRYTERTSNTSTLLEWGKLFELVVPAAKERYCYELEAIDISTGAVHVYDDPEQLCAVANDFVPSGAAPVTLPDAALSSRSCPIPPNGYDERWCDVNAERCGASKRPDDCYYYGHACLGEPEPRWGLPIDAGATDLDPPSPVLEPHSENCSVRNVGASIDTNPLGGFLLALTVMLRSRQSRAR